MTKRVILLIVALVVVVAVTVVIVYKPKPRLDEQIYIDLELMLYPLFQSHTLKNYPDMAREVREESTKLLGQFKKDDQYSILYKMGMCELYNEELARMGVKDDPVVVHDYNAFPWSYRKDYTTSYFSYRWTFDYDKVFKSVITTARCYKVVPSKFSREDKVFVIRRAISPVYKRD